MVVKGVSSNLRFFQTVLQETSLYMHLYGLISEAQMPIAVKRPLIQISHSSLHRKESKTMFFVVILVFPSLPPSVFLIYLTKNLNIWASNAPLMCQLSHCCLTGTPSCWCLYGMTPLFFQLLCFLGWTDAIHSCCPISPPCLDQPSLQGALILFFGEEHYYIWGNRLFILSKKYLYIFLGKKVHSAISKFSWTLLGF